MAIAYDNSGQSSGAGTTLTLSATTSGSDRFLIVYVYDSATLSTNTTGVTYNSVAMTKVGTSQQNGGPSWVSCWVLINPTTGANNIVASRTTAAGGDIAMVWASYTGTDQTTQPDATTVNFHNAATMSLTSSITPTTANAWVVMGGRDNFGTTITPSTNCTSRQEEANGTFVYDTNSAVPASSLSQTVTDTNSAYISGQQVAIRPAAGAATTIKSYDGVVTASVKTVLNATAIASRKTWDGIA